MTVPLAPRLTLANGVRIPLLGLGTWQDALLPRLDLSAMHTLDLTDRSRRSWLEARYHQERLDYALQWQAHSGGGTSVFGALPERRGWQLSLRYYF